MKRSSANPALGIAARATLLLPLALCVGATLAAAQSSSSGSKSGSASGSSSGSSSSASSGSATPGAPFSIETEMFTYKAVEENGEMIACDIARYLYGGEVVEPPSGAHAPCAISGGNPGATPGVILVSSDSSLLSDFQIWRGDMATMNALEARAENACTLPPEAKSAGAAAGETRSEPVHIKARGLLSGAVSAVSAISPAASAAGAVMSLLSSNESVMPVVGTVENPALLNEVARQLRSLHVLVLAPEIYNPNALGAVDYTNSPYLRNLGSLFAEYDQCTKAKDADHGSSDSSGQNAQSAQNAQAGQGGAAGAVLTAMDSFLKTALGAALPATPANEATAQPSGAQTAPNIPQSHLVQALAADEVARQMGFSGDGSGGANSTWQHLLWLKALESGGSVNKTSNIFGGKVTFGGGAVDTYSLFLLNGELVCSGNVYNFQPPITTKELEKAFHSRPANTVHPYMLNSTCTDLQ